ncbi:MAG TPA: hypothetical protein VFF81_12105 [Noviherbaspirillum sp.]|nr:hypothetical protein [Noviherbaspirillum sp.]
MDADSTTQGGTMAAYEQPAPHQILRDSKHRKLGEIRSAGRHQRLYDAAGRFCGEYRAEANTTYDRTYRVIGKGNLLAMLLHTKCTRNERP